MLVTSNHFDGPLAYQTAEFYHLAYLERVGEDPYTADLLEIGTRAYKYATALHRHRHFTHQAREDAVFAAYAGVLIYSIEHYGFNFTDISRLTSISVAKILQVISPDPRESEPRRYQMLCSQLREAPAIAQAVRAAELRCAARKLLEYANPQWVRENRIMLGTWVANAARLVDAMEPRLYSRRRFRKQREGIRRDIAALHCRIGQLRRRNRIQVPPPPHLEIPADGAAPMPEIATMMPGEVLHDVL